MSERGALADLPLDALLERQRETYAALADVQGELARRSARPPTQGPDGVLRIREACARMGWRYSWAVKHWRKLGGYRDVDGGLKVRASVLARHLDQAGMTR